MFRIRALRTIIILLHVDLGRLIVVYLNYTLIIYILIRSRLRNL